MAYGAYERGPMTFDKSEEVRKSMPENVKIHYWDYYSLEKEHYCNFIDKFQKFAAKVYKKNELHNKICSFYRKMHYRMCSFTEKCTFDRAIL